jgi:hypothetical protein
MRTKISELRLILFYEPYSQHTHRCPPGVAEELGCALCLDKPCGSNQKCLYPDSENDGQTTTKVSPKPKKKAATSKNEAVGNLSRQEEDDRITEFFTREPVRSTPPHISLMLEERVKSLSEEIANIKGSIQEVRVISMEISEIRDALRKLQRPHDVPSNPIVSLADDEFGLDFLDGSPEISRSQEAELLATINNKVNFPHPTNTPPPPMSTPSHPINTPSPKNTTTICKKIGSPSKITHLSPCSSSSSHNPQQVVSQVPSPAQTPPLPFSNNSSQSSHSVPKPIGLLGDATFVPITSSDLVTRAVTGGYRCMYCNNSIKYRTFLELTKSNK